jgi:hypothetical protein
MKKSALAVAALVGLTTLTATTSAPAAAPADSSAVQADHTRRFVLHETASHNVGRFSFVGTDNVRSRRTHNIVGYDLFTGHFDRTTKVGTVQVAVALKGGIIVGRIKGSFETNPVILHGPITKGSGKYVGIEGNITARLTNSNKTFVTLAYHF